MGANGNNNNTGFGYGHSGYGAVNNIDPYGSNPNMGFYSAVKPSNTFSSPSNNLTLNLNDPLSLANQQPISSNFADQKFSPFSEQSNILRQQNFAFGDDNGITNSFNANDVSGMLANQNPTTGKDLSGWDKFAGFFGNKNNFAALQAGAGIGNIALNAYNAWNQSKVADEQIKTMKNQNKVIETSMARNDSINRSMGVV